MADHIANQSIHVKLVYEMVQRIDRTIQQLDQKVQQLDQQQDQKVQQLDQKVQQLNNKVDKKFQDILMEEKRTSEKVQLINEGVERMRESLQLVGVPVVAILAVLLAVCLYKLFYA